MNTIDAMRDTQLWSEEPTADTGVCRARAHIGGLHCSLCTGTIERALGQQPGVRRVAVSLTHEQALENYLDFAATYGASDIRLLLGGLGLALLYVLLTFRSPWQFLFLLSAPLLLQNGLSVWRGRGSQELDPLLKQMSIATLLFAITFGLGHLLA
jgi:copper chaperone CopZ